MTYVDAQQVNSRSAARKAQGAQLEHHNKPHPLTRGHITIEQLVERYDTVTVEGAWLPSGEEGYIVFLGDPPQAGQACYRISSAFASAIVARGDEVRNAKLSSKPAEGVSKDEVRSLS